MPPPPPRHATVPLRFSLLWVPPLASLTDHCVHHHGVLHPPAAYHLSRRLARDELVKRAKLRQKLSVDAFFLKLYVLAAALANYVKPTLHLLE